jgi:hypothetical protein
MANRGASCNFNSIGKAAVAFDDYEGRAFADRCLQPQGHQPGQTDTGTQNLAWAKMVMTGGGFLKQVG